MYVLGKLIAACFQAPGWEPAADSLNIAVESGPN